MHSMRRRLLMLVVAAFVLAMSGLIMTPYGHYLPPDFDSGFLRQKESFFYSSGYFVGFYAHLVAAPTAILIGTAQLSRTLRQQAPALHEKLGTAYSVLVLGGAAPGGAIMALRANGGCSSVICFLLLSGLTWWVTWVGWQKARQFKFREHGRWMLRSYVLLSSAIILRCVYISLKHWNLDPTLTYQIAVWASWVPAIVILEMGFRWRLTHTREPTDAAAREVVP